MVTGIYAQWTYPTSQLIDKTHGTRASSHTYGISASAENTAADVDGMTSQLQACTHCLQRQSSPGQQPHATEPRDGAGEYPMF